MSDVRKRYLMVILHAGPIPIFAFHLPEPPSEGWKNGDNVVLYLPAVVPNANQSLFDLAVTHVLATLPDDATPEQVVEQATQHLALVLHAVGAPDAQAPLPTVRRSLEDQLEGNQEIFPAHSGLVWFLVGEDDLPTLADWLRSLWYEAAKDSNPLVLRAAGLLQPNPDAPDPSCLQAYAQILPLPGRTE